MTAKTIVSYESYQKSLQKKHGILLKSYIDFRTPVKHTCPDCRKPYLVSPAALLKKVHPVCLSCFYKNHNNETKRTKDDIKKLKKDFLAKLKKKFNGKIQAKGKFTKLSGKLDFKCKCGHEWTSTPTGILDRTFGCPICAKGLRKSLDEIKSELKEVNPGLKVTSKERKTRDFIKVKCRKCLFKWNARINNILSGGSGCPACFKSGVTDIKSKEIIFNKKKLLVQGYEEIALHYLALKGVKKSKIKVFSSGEIPVIEYPFQGSIREYWPDIQVDKTIYEVKSEWTLLSAFDKNKAKAKGCIKKGYKFVMLLVTTRQETFVLPNDWYTWSKEGVENYIRQKTVEKIVVLGLDPGATNFGWSVIKMDRKFKPKVLKSGMLASPIKEIKGNVSKAANLFTNELASLIEENSVTHVCCERFMTRGNKGTLIEAINIMIGILLSITIESSPRASDTIKLIPAAQWKNEWNKARNLEVDYEKFAYTKHQLDSIGIGVYGAYYFMGKQPYFNLNTFADKLLHSVRPS